MWTILALILLTLVKVVVSTMFYQSFVLCRWFVLFGPNPSALQRLWPIFVLIMTGYLTQVKLKCRKKNNYYLYTLLNISVFILCDDLNDKNDMNRQLRSLYARANTLLRKFLKCSISVKLTLLQSYCSNAHCSHLWVIYTKATFNKLKVAYNNVYRRVLWYTRRDSASMMLVTNGIDSFEILIGNIFINSWSVLQKNGAFVTIIVCF